MRAAVDPVTSSGDVPVYDLFGGREGWPTPDLIHVEPIAKTSTLYDWKIIPHTHDALLQLLYVQRGRFRMYAEDRELVLDGPCLAVFPPLAVHGFDFPPDVEGYVLMVPAFAIAELLGPAGEIVDLLGRVQVIDGDMAGSDTADLNELFVRLLDEYEGIGGGRQLAMHSVIGLIFVWLARRILVGVRRPLSVRDRGRERVRQYRELIQVHFRDARPLSFYAEKLGVTTAQLNNCCRRHSGKSALMLLHDRVTLEAKRGLIYSTRTVGEVAFSLGFKDPAYFARFFARMTGRSPSQFREQSRYQVGA